MADAFSQFIDTYYLDPLRYPDRVAPYNVVNTVTFAILALAAVYLLYKFLRKIGVEVDEPFVFAVLPWAILGSATRVLVDAQALPRSVDFFGFQVFPFVTPYIYILIVAVSLASLLLCKKYSRTPQEFTSRYQRVGIAFAALALIPLVLRVLYPLHGLLILGLALVGAGVVWGVSKLLSKNKPKLDALESLVAFGQSLDGAATFVGVAIGTPTVQYVEQHVVGNAIFDFFGNPFGFYVVKIAFATLVIWAVRREMKGDDAEENRQRAFLLMLLAIFGLAPGLRDALRLIVGV